jgi:hypothetical protein
MKFFNYSILDLLSFSRIVFFALNAKALKDYFYYFEVIIVDIFFFIA